MELSELFVMNNKTVRIFEPLTLSVAFSIFAVACGSSSGGSENISGGPACGNQPCGGDVVGTWNWSDVCIRTDVLKQDFLQGSMGACSQATVGANLSAAGAFTLNADHTYAVTLTMSGTTTTNVPMSCLAAGDSCAGLSARLQAALASDSSIQSASCSGTTTCVCTEILTPSSQNESGTYSTSGSSLVTTPTGAAADTVQYCVKDTTITFHEPAMGTSTMASLVAAIVADKAQP
jgi:hypothetical protein